MWWHRPLAGFAGGAGTALSAMSIARLCIESFPSAFAPSGGTAFWHSSEFVSDTQVRSTQARRASRTAMAAL